MALNPLNSSNVEQLALKGLKRDSNKMKCLLWTNEPGVIHEATLEHIRYRVAGISLCAVEDRRRCCYEVQLLISPSNTSMPCRIPVYIKNSNSITFTRPKFVANTKYMEHFCTQNVPRVCSGAEARERHTKSGCRAT